MIVALFILALILLILTLVLTSKDRTNYINGILLTFSIILFILPIYMQVNNIELSSAIVYLVKDISKYITYVIAILFMYNGVYNSFTKKKVRKNNITDLLSFLAGITFIMIIILTDIRQEKIFFWIDVLIFYIDIMFISYLLNSLIYRITTREGKYDIIIILGAGLVEGIRPSRTLNKRLNKAIELFNINPEAIIIASGGKGSNEKISEAEAMKIYLIEKGIPEQSIILEDKSTNTYENLMFSKEKIKDIKKKDPQIAVVSSDFHIYRAVNYSKLSKLKVTGIGSKTVFYYRPAAFIREFAAMFVKQKYWIVFYLILVIFIYTII